MRREPGLLSAGNLYDFDPGDKLAGRNIAAWFITPRGGGGWRNRQRDLTLNCRSINQLSLIFLFLFPSYFSYAFSLGIRFVLILIWFGQVISKKLIIEPQNMYMRCTYTDTIGKEMEYSIASQIPIFKRWSGRFDNWSQRIKLLRWFELILFEYL